MSNAITRRGVLGTLGALALAKIPFPFRPKADDIVIATQMPGIAPPTPAPSTPERMTQLLPRLLIRWRLNEWIHCGVGKASACCFGEAAFSRIRFASESRAAFATVEPASAAEMRKFRSSEVIPFCIWTFLIGARLQPPGSIAAPAAHFKIYDAA